MAARVFELRKSKIATARRAPESGRAPFQHREELQAIVAGWPWCGAPPLLLADEEDPVFWAHHGGSRADLLGYSQRGRLVAAEVFLDAFVERKPGMQQLLRGLCRLDEHRSGPGHLLGPFAPDPKSPLTAIMIGDGAVFPRDDKQVIKIRKDMQALFDDPGGQWHAPEDAPDREKWDTRTPGWVAGLGARPLHFLVFAVSRYASGGDLVIACERCLDQTFVRRA
ncbi:MAG: hypothetical protein JXR83_07260 [Deltaproteobacteria bacterium]|nr:hypothetical protein [Deltaproteobacteria bacterium]